MERTVLIVDDDPHVREVMHQIFLSNGHKCTLAGDGREGLEVFQNTHPPLVVTDIKMPGMDGVELLRAVREADQDAAVIVLTGAADMKTAIECLRLGAYDFILKPVNIEELLIAADRALERLRDPPDRLRVGLRRDGEAGLDDIHPQRLELAGHLDCRVDPEGERGRLVAVPEGGVEHDQSSHRGVSLRRRPPKSQSYET